MRICALLDVSELFSRGMNSGPDTDGGYDTIHTRICSCPCSCSCMNSGPDTDGGYDTIHTRICSCPCSCSCMNSGPDTDADMTPFTLASVRVHARALV
ncbi:hypothetical protein EVAR_5312_1 [Eumeta japonica]|uniref:Uncharacterized protein n=1 Tax=Eumeta variegata TaxID=151549 RepID=A0A4C1TN75_EUMVA|nr:hypothetical protein EVAR_5312_1 [Eumeta japonica]